MKLKTILAVPLAALMLAGGTIPAFAAPDPGTKGEQTQLIVSSISVWKPARKGDYVLTDLDGNGRYEIITAKVSKKQVTELHAWEVDATGSVILPVAEPWGDGNSQPDIRTGGAEVYTDPADGARYYVFEDVQMTEDDEETSELVALSLQNGAFVSEVLSVPAAERFAGFGKQTVSFNWIDTNEHSLDGAPMEQIMELAEESLAGFLFSEAVTVPGTAAAPDEASGEASGAASGEASGKASGEASQETPEEPVTGRGSMALPRR